MAKLRKVILTIEVETDAPLEALRSAESYGEAPETIELWDETVRYEAHVSQVQANVIK